MNNIHNDMKVWEDVYETVIANSEERKIKSPEKTLDAKEDKAIIRVSSNRLVEGLEPLG